MSMIDWMSSAVALVSASLGCAIAMLCVLRIEARRQERELSRQCQRQRLGAISSAQKRLQAKSLQDYLSGEWVINHPSIDVSCPVPIRDIIQVERRDGEIVRAMAGNLTTLEFGWGRSSVDPRPSDVMRYRRWDKVTTSS